MASQVFVGRQRELAVLAGLAARARADQPQVVLVEGEAGMGKSSLITKFVPAVGGTAVLRASGEEGESTLSYGVISQVAAAARGLGSGHARAVERRAGREPGPVGGGSRAAVGLRHAGAVGPADAVAG